MWIMWEWVTKGYVNVGDSKKFCSWITQQIFLAPNMLDSVRCWFNKHHRKRNFSLIFVLKYFSKSVICLIWQRTYLGPCTYCKWTRVRWIIFRLISSYISNQDTHIKRFPRNRYAIVSRNRGEIVIIWNMKSCRPFSDTLMVQGEIAWSPKTVHFQLLITMIVEKNTGKVLSHENWEGAEKILAGKHTVDVRFKIAEMFRASRTCNDCRDGLRKNWMHIKNSKATK